MAELAPDDDRLPAPSTAAVLAAAARALHDQPDVGTLLSWAADAACALSEARACGIVLFDGDPPLAWTATGWPDTRALGDPRRYAALRPAVQGDGPVRLAELVNGPPSTRSLARALPELGSLLALPVPGTDAVPRGVLVVAHPRPYHFDAEAEAAVAALVAHLGVALDNHATLARLYEARHAQRLVVRELQNAVRPTTPVLDFTELGVCYEPAAESEPTGGDLWDWRVLPDGSLHFAIVDIMGKGVEATKDALFVMHAVRVLVFDGCPLPELVARADSIVSSFNPDLVATLQVGRYDPLSGAVRLVGAGHPPALVVTRRAVHELPAPGIPIGWPGAGSTEVVETKLDRWDTLLLYTDGLVEARRDIVEGMRTLKRFAAETQTFPANQQARVLVDRVLSDAVRQDDSLVVVLRRRTPPPQARLTTLSPFHHRLSRTDASVALARRLLEDWLVAVPVDGPVVPDLLLVASELCANAVKHARWSNGGVVLRAFIDGQDVVLRVEDDGDGLALTYDGDEPPPPGDAERGRGLWLVQTLMDEVGVDEGDGTTVVKARKRSVAAVAP